MSQCQLPASATRRTNSASDCRSEWGRRCQLHVLQASRRTCLRSSTHVYARASRRRQLHDKVDAPRLCVKLTLTPLFRFGTSRNNNLVNCACRSLVYERKTANTSVAWDERLVSLQGIWRLYVPHNNISVDHMATWLAYISITKSR